MKKFWAAVLAATVLVSTAFAGPDPDETKNIGKFGHVGLWNTLSGQTLGYSRLSVNVYANHALDKSFIKNYYLWDTATSTLYKDKKTDFAPGDYVRTNFNLSIAYGLARFLDLGVMLPIYVDNIGKGVRFNNLGYEWPETGDDDLYTQAGAGDLEISVKFLYPPYPHRKFFQMSYYGALTLPTGADNWGLFPRHTYYIDKKADERYVYVPDAYNHRDLKSTMGAYNFYSSRNTEIDMKMLWTWDFREMSDFFPVLFHVNYGLRWTLQYVNEHVFYLNSGLEVRPADWISIFADFSAEPRFGSIQQDETFAIYNPRTSEYYDQLGAEVYTPQYPGDMKQRSLLDDPIRLSPGVAILTPIGITVSLGFDISLAHIDGFYFGNAKTAISREKINAGTRNDPDWVLKKENLSTVLIETGVEPKVSFVGSIGWNGLTVKTNTVVPDAPILAPDCDTVRLVDTVYVDKIDTLKVEIEKTPVTYSITASVAAGQGTITPVGVAVVNEGALATYSFVPAQGYSIEQVMVNGASVGAVAQYTFPSVRSNQVITVSFKLDPIAIEPAPAPVAFEIPREGLVLRGVNFDTGKAILKASSYDVLEGVYRSLKEWPEIKLEVQGHTDNVGKHEHNIKLSKDRANTVMKFFIEKGIPASQLRAVGYGSKEPIADNDTPSGRELNRRVTLVKID